MRAMAIVVGLIGLIVLPFSPMMGLLMLALAVGLWVADLALKAQTPSSPDPTQHSHPTVAPTVASRPDTSRPAPQPVNMQWLGPGRHIMVDGYTIADAPVYYSAGRSTVREASCIEIGLPVGEPIAEPKGALGYWPQYAEISPGQRANYLQWLAGGRQDPLDDIGYAFLYFYGLERRVLVDGLDTDLVLEEVIRLLGLYGQQSASFNGYLSDFITYANATRGLESLDEDWFARYLARTPSPLALAWLVVHDRALPADLALAIAKQDVRSARSVVVNRVPEQFQQLFAHKYQERFGAGMKLRTATRQQRVEYRRASPTLVNRTSSTYPQGRQPVDMPNVYGIESQFKPLGQIWAECIDELRPLSRHVAKAADLTSRAAYWALPPELRAEADHPDKPEWERIVAAQTPYGAFALVPVSSLAQSQGIERRPKLTHKQSEDLAATAYAVGFGITPDCRAFGRAYRWDERVAMFRMGHLAPPTDAGFLCAACMTELGIALAAADGTADDEEIRHIAHFLEKQFALSSDDALHLEGYRQVLLKQPPRMSSLGRRLQEKLTADQRELIGKFLVGVAAASGGIDRKELAALRSAYRSLYIESTKLDQLLAEISGPDEPVEIRAAGHMPTGERIPTRATQHEPLVVLDMGRVQRLIEGTAQVQQLLATAMMAAQEAEEVQSVPVSAHLTESPAAAAACRTSSLHVLDGLDEQYYPIIAELLTRDEWQPQDIDSLARKHGFMRSGMIDVINDWAMERFGDYLIDDQKVPYVTRRDLLEQAQ